jgi:ASC-1-like (ASCH) protein
MKLKSRYFDYMKNGTKRIEIRLNDEKRKLIKVGDTITFLKEPELTEKLMARVVALLHFESFEKMAKNLPLAKLGFENETKEQVVEAYHQFYSEQDEKEYGVVVIQVEVK